MRKTIFNRWFWLVFVCGVFVLLFLVGLFYLMQVKAGLPKEESLKQKLIPYRSVTFLDRHGQQIAPSGAFIAIETVPQHLVDALIAVEDRRFFSHSGVDPVGIIRAFIRNIRAGGIRQGGSTLTQQLARNLYLNHDQTIKRKIQESLLALWLERHLSKAEILELYFNHVYFGAGAWGVEAAAQRYFQKSVTELTLGESALLVGLLRAPSHYNPASTPKRAEVRTNTVLEVMLKTGKITEEERYTTFQKPIEVMTSTKHPGAGYFLDWIAGQVTPFAEQSMTAHLIVETTLDLSLQEYGENIIKRTLDEKGSEKVMDQGALVAFNGKGEVLAMVGGRSYQQGGFNRANKAFRQPGSAFKPFVYLAALESGIRPWEVRSEASLDLKGWSPRNSSGHYDRERSLVNALAFSVNTIAVRLGEEVGRQNVIKTAQRLGYTSPLKPKRSLALGSQETTLMTLTSAYIPFANLGYRVKPSGVKRIYAKDGRILYQQKTVSEKVINEKNLKRINMMLERVVTYGTGRRAKIQGRFIAGKTGTTNGYRDAWFIGYEPDFIAGVWYGNDRYQSMKKVFGGSYPAISWREFSKQALKGKPVKRLPFIESPVLAEPIRTEEKNILLTEEKGQIEKNTRTGTLSLLLPVPFATAKEKIETPEVEMLNIKKTKALNLTDRK